MVVGLGHDLLLHLPARLAQDVLVQQLRVVQQLVREGWVVGDGQAGVGKMVAVVVVVGQLGGVVGVVDVVSAVSVVAVVSVVGVVSAVGVVGVVVVFMSAVQQVEVERIQVIVVEGVVVVVVERVVREGVVRHVAVVLQVALDLPVGDDPVVSSARVV